jgi:multidrug resistance efflux pump
MNRRLILSLIFIVLLAAGGAWLYRWLQTNPDPAVSGLSLRENTSSGIPLQATGIIEASSVTLSSELGGRIVALHAAEGTSVTAGQLLIALDDSLQTARLAQADAAVAQAKAQLALLEAGARPEEIARAEALVDQAIVAAAAARQAWSDAQVLRDNRQALDLAIIEAETALAKAQQQAKAARLAAEAADLERDLWGRVTQLLADGIDVTLPGGGVIHVNKPAERDQANVQWNVASQKSWEAWQTAYAAEDAARAASVALANLRQQRALPIAEDTRVNQAEAAYHQAEAAVDQARAALQALEEGATPEQIEAARQAVERANAARGALNVQLAKTQIAAPRAGLISVVAVHEGEVALPGAPLLEIADLSEVTLTVYVPQPALGRVRLGQPAQVAVDSFPGRAFTGHVTHIADQAEFTPKNVQTQEERVNTVFAVEITLANPDGALKPGMPADAVFAEETP